MHQVQGGGRRRRTKGSGGGGPKQLRRTFQLMWNEFTMLFGGHFDTANTYAHLLESTDVLERSYTLCGVAREKCFTNDMVYEGSNSRSRIRLDRVQAHTPDLKFFFYPRSTLKIGPPETHPILVHPHIYHPKSVSTPTPLVSGPSFQATLKKSAPYLDPTGSTLFY